MLACRTRLRAAVAIGCLAVARPVAASPTEPEMMAVYIERFTLFVDWPPFALGGPDSPFVMCVVGRAAVREPLLELARLRLLKGHRAVVRTVDAVRHPDAIAACHVAFISDAEAKQLPLLLVHAGGRPVLTIADTPGFGAAGVVINFYREDRLLRFEINPAAARTAGLRVRSRLMRLARQVGGP
jgi:hypothetical protein